MFSYFGSKSKLIKHYPKPCTALIIEPFAGSARYALEYWYRDVILVDKDKNIIDVWRYLQAASEKDILGLPKLKAGMDLRELNISEPERLFLGFMCGIGRAKPARKVSPWAEIHFSEIGRRNKYEKIAEQLSKIRHWQFVHGDYTCLSSPFATWFIDPPYQVMGRTQYKHSAKDIDYQVLSAWVQSRRGQVIACENVGADWLPFQPMATLYGANAKSQEALWTRAELGAGGVG